MRWLTGGDRPADDGNPPAVVNTRNALWPSRYDAIALQECVDRVEAAPAEDQVQVKWDLPCAICPEADRCLNAKRKELGSLVYARENLTQPMSSESSLFPRSLFTPMLNDRLECQRHYQKPAGLEDDIAVVQAWDLAWSERTGGDWLVCVTATVDMKRGHRRLLDIQRWQRISFIEQVALIEQRWRDFNADMVVIESDASQQIWAQYLSQTSPVPVVPHAAANSKTKLEAGVPGLLIQFENRRWELPWRRGGYHHDEVENMLDEFAAFGWSADGKLEGVGQNDDTVMAFWHCEWAIQRMLMQRGRHAAGVVPGARS